MVNTHHFIASMVNDKENLNFVSLSESMLSSAEQNRVSQYAKRNIHEYEAFWYDKTLYDLIPYVKGIDKSVLSELHRAKHYKGRKVGKHFLHVLPTLDNLRHYGDANPSNFNWNINFRVARSIVEDTFALAKLKPLQITTELEAADVFSNLKASAGAIGDGGKLKNWDRIKQLGNEILSKIRHDSPFSSIWIPCIPGHRAQIKEFSKNGRFNPEYKTKDRLIWIVDGATVLVESLYAKRIIEWSKNNFYGYAGGKTPGQLTHYISNASENMNYWYCTDYSKFDQTIPDWLIHECFDIVRQAYPKSEKKVIDWIEYNFTNTKIALPDGSVVEVHKGIPSGSNFTQFIGSLANYLMGLTYISSTFKGSFEWKKIQTKGDLRVNGSQNLSMFVMGDDNLFFTHNEIDLSDMASYLTHNFGVKVNADKTVHGKYGTPPEFLHRTWYASGCDRDQLDMILNLVFSESARSYDNYTPVDILFSIYYTFPLAFHAMKTTMADWFRKAFEEFNVTASTLEGIPIYDLPGSARAFSEEARKMYVESFLSLSNSK